MRMWVCETNLFFPFLGLTENNDKFDTRIFAFALLTTGKKVLNTQHSIIYCTMWGILNCNNVKKKKKSFSLYLVKTRGCARF